MSACRPMPTRACRAGGGASSDADADRIDRETDHGAASRRTRRASGWRPSPVSASWGRPPSPPRSRTRRHSGRVVILRPGSGSCRARIRPAASRSSVRSRNRAIAICDAFWWSERLRCCGARSSKPEKYPWLTQLLARKPFKVVAVALANKMARIAWALLAKGGTYRAPALVAAA